METVIKTIPAENGELYVTEAGQRRQLAHFCGKVQITEEQKLIPMLGTIQKGIKRIYASFIVCGDMEYQRKIDDSYIHTGKAYDAIADVEGERVCFSGLRFEDSDPIENELIFEITDVELIKKLIGCK